MARFDVPNLEHPWLQAFVASLDRRSKALGCGGTWTIDHSPMARGTERTALTLERTRTEVSLEVVAREPLAHVAASIRLCSGRRRDRGKVLWRARDVLIGASAQTAADVLAGTIQQTYDLEQGAPGAASALRAVWTGLREVG